MYNLNSHYETIFHALKGIIAHRRVLYLYPYGASQPEFIETLTDNLSELNDKLFRERRTETAINEGPLLIFYDQEPILGEYNYQLFDHIKSKFLGPHVLITTEKNSDTVNAIAERYNWPVVYYFHHAFAAHDWYRGIHYDARLVPPNQRKLKKKYVTFNRLTSNARIYRSLFVSELIQRGILDQGYVSYSDVCPDNGQNFVHNLAEARDSGLISSEVASKAMHNLAQVKMPLRIDFQDEVAIPNHSFVLSAVTETQESFVYVVTETCYWERKCHLTEKTFKPIVSRMPFILVGPAHNLAYLRSYGFQTFDRWIDESYDTIEDPIERMQAIGQVLENISNRSISDLEELLKEMQTVLDHNYNLFYSTNFLDRCWQELFDGITNAVNVI
jgi:hypothetical protein